MFALLAFAWRTGASKATVCFCKSKNCNFTPQIPALLVDPWDDSQSIEQEVASFILGYTDIEIYFNAAQPDNQLKFYFPMNIFINKNIRILKLENQTSPHEIKFGIEKEDDYTNTIIEINNTLVLFETTKINQLKMKEFTYIIDSNQKQHILSTHINLSSQRLIISTEIIFNFKNIEITDTSHPIIIYISRSFNMNTLIKRNSVQIGDINDSMLVTFPSKQKIIFTSFGFSVNNKIVLKQEDIFALLDLPVINISMVYDVTIEGDWPEAGDTINNFILVPENKTLQAFGLVRLHGIFLPFNIIATELNFYINKDNSKVFGFIHTEEKSNFYIDLYSSDQLKLEINRHEKGVVAIYASKLQVTINCLQNDLPGNDFPVYVAFSNTEIAQVIIKKIEFPQIKTPLKHFKLINTMVGNPKDDEVYFLIFSSQPFLTMEFSSFYYFTDLSIIFTEDSNKVHGLNNEINGLFLYYDISYESKVVNLLTYGILPSGMVTILCYADDEEKCISIGQPFYTIKDIDDITKNSYVNQEFKYYHLYIFTTEPVEIGFQNLISSGYIFNVYLNGASVAFNFSDDILVLTQLQLFDANLISNIDFICDQLVLTNVTCNNGLHFTYNCSYVSVDKISIYPALRTDHIQHIVIDDNNDQSRQIDITNDYLLVDGHKLEWIKYDDISIYGSEFIVTNYATHIKGFYIYTSYSDSVIQLYNDFEKLTIDESINVYSIDYSLIVYIYQPYLNENITFLVGSVYKLIISYYDTANFCIYYDNISHCPDNGFIKYRYTEIDFCAESSADRINIYFYGWIISTGFVPLINLSLYDKKELFLFSTHVIQIKIVAPSNIDYNFTSVTFSGFYIYFYEEYEGQIIHARFGYLTVLESGFMNNNNAYLEVDHLYCRFYNLVNWKIVTIVKDLTLFSFNTFLPYNVEFVYQERMKNRLNLVLNDTFRDRRIIFGDNCLYYNNGTFHFNEREEFTINFFIVDPHHNFTIECNETGHIPSLNLHLSSYGPIKFNGTWEQNYFYDIDIKVDKYSVIILENMMNMNIMGTGQVNLVANSTDIGVFGSILFDQDDDTIMDHLTLSSLLPENQTSLIYLDYLSYDMDTLPSLTAINFSSPNIICEIGFLYHFGNTQLIEVGFKFLIGKYGVSEIRILNPVLNIRIKQTLYLGLLFTDYLINESEYKILHTNLTLLKGPSVDMYKDFDLTMEEMVSNPTHGFKNSIKLEKEDVTVLGFTNFYLYSTEDPLDVPYYIQFAVSDDSFYDYVDLRIKKFEEIETVFDSFPFHLRRLTFIVSNSLIEPYPIRLSTFDSRYQNLEIEIISTNPKPSNIIYIDEPGSAISYFRFLNVELKTPYGSKLKFDNINTLELVNVSFQNQIMNDRLRIPQVIGDCKSIQNLIAFTSFSGTTNLYIKQISTIIFGEDRWNIGTNIGKSDVVIMSEQFKQVFVEFKQSIELNLLNTDSQTRIRGLNVIEVNNSNGSISSYDQVSTVYFFQGWNNIVDFDNISITSCSPISIITFNIPFPDIFKAPSATVTFNKRSTSRFKISNVVIQRSFEIDVTGFNEYMHVIEGDKMVVENKVDISFADDIGKIETKELHIRNDAHLSISKIDVASLIVMDPGSMFNVNVLGTTNQTKINMKWNSTAFPSIKLQKDTNLENLNLILDEEYPNIDLINQLTYMREIVLISGKFNCDKLQFTLNMVSSSKYYQSGNDNIFSVNCVSGSEENKLFLFASKTVDLESETTKTNQTNDDNIGMIIGIVGGIVVLIVLVTVIICICKDKKKPQKKVTKPKQPKQTISLTKIEAIQSISSSMSSFSSISITDYSESGQ